jgi:DNA-binding SARP family transcriptional activator
MRLSRTSLLARLTEPDAPWFIVVEAPTGFGKSWLLRKAAPAGALRLRGELGPIADHDYVATGSIIIDDAHLLSRSDVERLVEFVEDYTATFKVFVAGRIIADELHDAAHLVDGLVVDAMALAVTPDELVDEVDGLSRPDATQLVEATDGCIRVIASALGQTKLEPNVDPASIATRILRSAAAASLQQLDGTDAGLVSLLSRTPGIDRGLLTRLGGPGFVDRALEAGVLLRRQAAAGFDVVAGATVPPAPVAAEVSGQLASALIDRGRPIDAVGLLIDAGAHERAARELMELPESVTREVEPRAMLSLLARLGTVIEREPALLLKRAASSVYIGRVDLARADIDRALELAVSAEPPMRRRITVEAAEWMLLQGRTDEAVSTVQAAITELGPGEDRTYARAHAVLADAASTSFNRASLHRAAEWYRAAAAAWEGCGEFAKARLCRCDLATQVLEPLGRFDEALAQLGVILAGDLGDAERTWMLFNEGLVLMSANRLEAAESRFSRVSDLGYVEDNPRMIAAAAWGHGMVAARREDVGGALKWFGTAENTALGTDDDLLGVPFHCEAATALGALGELEMAERHLASAQQRDNSYPDKLALTKFILDARRGVRGDVAAQLEITPPVELWRVLLVSGLAAARCGAIADAQRLLLDSERELITFGFSDFKTLGERKTFEELRALLRHAPAEALEPVALAASPRPATMAPDRVRTNQTRIRVIGGPIVVQTALGTVELPAGNPQRLVGVVVAHGGMANFDQISESIWPGDDVEASRVRLRNVLLRLRRVAGDILVRSGSGVRLAPDVECDLYEFDRLANDAMSAVRADPDLAGHLAERAVNLVDGAVLAEFEYEEWAVDARRNLEQRLIGLLDLLSVRAEDAGDLPVAQSLAERALRLDRYTDSRYVRLAELLTLQGRAAAAVAVLEDAAEVARDLGGAVPTSVKRRRDDLMRRVSNG